MAAIVLGLVAALAWGIHDLAVRYVSQRVAIATALLCVLGSGLVFLALTLLGLGLVGPIGVRAGIMSGLAGAAFALAGVALYRAFAIGPVRLVAPVIGAYPVLSVGLAAWTGVPVSGWAVLAVLAVLAGIAVVSSGRGEDGDGPPVGGGDRKVAAIAWSVAAALGFFVTFSLGQAAAQGAETGASLLIARAAAVAVALGYAIVAGADLLPPRGRLAVLLVMGALDAVALTSVMVAGNLPFAAFATVASSAFGIVTIVLAWAFLAEAMRPHQWLGVALVFAGIGYLGLE